MVAATKPTSRLVRYWVSSTSDSPIDLDIRIEWLTKDGQLRTSLGRYFVDDHAIKWETDEPPNGVESLALDCALDAGVYTTHREIEFAGVESSEAMWALVERTCASCGTRVASPDLLSRDGECAKCWAATMAAEPITIAIPKQSLAECAAEWRRQLAEQGLVGGAS